MIKKRFANTVIKVYSKQEILKLTIRLNTTNCCSNAKDHGSLFWRWSSWPPTDFDSWHLGSQHSCGFRDGLFHNMFSTPQVIILVHALWFFSVVLRACQDFRGDELWPRQRLCGTARVRGKKGLPWHLGLNGCDTSWLWFPRSKPQQADRVEPDQPAEPQKAAIH